LGRGGWWVEEGLGLEGGAGGWACVDTEDQESDEVLLAVGIFFLGRRARMCMARRVTMICAQDSRLDAQQRTISGGLDYTK